MRATAKKDRATVVSEEMDRLDLIVSSLVRQQKSSGKMVLSQRKIAAVALLLGALPFLRTSCTSFPGSAWERTVPEAPPRKAEPPSQWVPRQSLGTSSPARTGVHSLHLERSNGAPCDPGPTLSTYLGF